MMNRISPRSLLALARYARTGGALVLLCSLTACMVGPDYVRPTVDVGSQFREINGWQPADPTIAARPKGSWWEVFQDDKLNALMSELNISNLNIAQAEAQYRQAIGVLRGAQAPLMPTVSANTSLSRVGGSATSAVGVVSANMYDTYGVTANASWTLDIWGSVRRNIESQNANKNVAAANLGGARLTAQSTLALTYMQLRTLDETARVFKSSVDSYEQSLVLTTNKYDAGVANPGDVATAKTQLESTRAQLIDTEQQRAVYENAIAVLLGRPPSTFSIPPMPFALKPPVIPVGLPSSLLEQRPDIASAEMQVAAANAQIGVAIAAWFPSLTLNTSGGYRTNDFFQWITAPAQFWSLGPALAQAIFDGGARNAVIEQNRAIYDAQTAAYRLTVLQALQQVDNAMVQLRVYDKELGVRREAVDAAKEAVRLAMNQYNQGLIDYLSVSVLQNSALTNESSYISLLGNRLASSVQLVVALGGGWSMENLEKPVKQSDMAKVSTPTDDNTKTSPSLQPLPDGSNTVSTL